MMSVEEMSGGPGKLRSNCVCSGCVCVGGCVHGVGMCGVYVYVIQVLKVYKLY